jgi:DNA polymerase-3 subunit epsilon
MTDLAAAAALLESSPDFKVLRRLVVPATYGEEPWNLGDRSPVKLGLFCDTETTGLDTAHDQIIEFGAVQFSYNATSGEIYSIVDEYCAFEEPTVPITESARAVHGITDEQLKGQRLDDARINGMLTKSALVMCHHSGFDRPLIERRLPQFAGANFGCTLNEVPWEKFGCVGKKLEHVVLYCCSAFYDAHRALDDCRAGVHALATACLEGRTAMSYLLEAARTPTTRVSAFAAPFESKDTLKSRGYSWSVGQRVWYRDVRGESDGQAVADELAWLKSHVPSSPRLRRIEAKDRYSVRA